MAKKDVHGVLTEVKNYDPLRKVLRIIYMYGAYSDIDLLAKNLLDVKERAFKDIIKRVENYLNAGEYSNTEHFSFHLIPGRKTDKRARKILKDPYKSALEVLASTYHQHTVSTSDIIFFVYLLHIFHNEDDYDDCLIDIPELPEKLVTAINDNIIKMDVSKAFTSLEFYAAISEFYSSFSQINTYFSNGKLVSEGTEFPLSHEQVIAKLNECVNIGFLHFIKPNRYVLANNIFDVFENFDEAEDEHRNLIDIQSMIRFFYNYSSLCVPGYFLSEKINQLLMAEYIDIADKIAAYRLTSQPEDFFFEKARFQNVLDDDITWQLIKAIDGHCPVTYEYQTSTYDQTSSFTILPVKIVDDAIYGRHYVWGYEYKEAAHKKIGSIVLHRLDRVYSLKTIHRNTTDLPEALYDVSEFEKWIEHAFNIDGSIGSCKTIDLEFSFDDSSYANYMQNKLVTGKHSTSLISEDNNTYTLSLSLKNPAEAIPWINSFGKFVKVLPTSDKAFFEAYKSYVKENSSIYEPF